jgi:putative phosphoribosyl transferase
MDAPFADRAEAGRRLGAAVLRLGLRDPVVLALPRGGVPVAVEVARALHAPLDLLLVRKIGAAFDPELAVAAVVDTPGDDLVMDEALMAETGMHEAEVRERAVAQRAEIARRRVQYLGARARVPLRGRSVVLVDDGIATGTTVRAALKALRRSGAAEVVLAVPVAPGDTLERLRAEVDRIVCLREPQPFRAVGLHYEDFRQVEDDEVAAALTAA